jgi:DNA-binding transcriptional ArsR family regulator
MTEPVTLAPAAVEAVARRVVELLADEHATPPTARLLDAADLADLLGVSRATVYEHADALGAVRIGDGPRGRLRFDAETALAAWQTRDREPALEPVPRPPRRRTRTRGPELLPIRGRAA